MSFYNNDNEWIGQSIGDRQRYRLDAHLGRGGMGDVFLAMDVVLGKKVALKLLKGALTTTEEFKKRFDREVAICAALSSDNIVQVSDYGITEQGQPFYVMEYLQGETLRQRLMRQIRLPVGEALSIMIQICLGLQTPHEGIPLWIDGGMHSELVRVVHRDLKPDNIFLISKGSGEMIKLLDFGIAKIYYEEPDNKTSLTRTNEFMGTPRYASPEQLSGLQDLDARADIYSLGVILYEMLSGQSPFYEEGKALTSMVAWAIAHTSQSPRPLRTQAACLNLTPSLEATILKCLHKDPNDRFTSVRELREALESELFKLQQEPDITISYENTHPIEPSETLPSSHSVLREVSSDNPVSNDTQDHEVSRENEEPEYQQEINLHGALTNASQATAAPPELRQPPDLSRAGLNLRSQVAPDTFVMPDAEIQVAQPKIALEPKFSPLAMILGVVAFAITALAGVYFFLNNKPGPPPDVSQPTANPDSSQLTAPPSPSLPSSSSPSPALPLPSESSSPSSSPQASGSPNPNTKVIDLCAQDNMLSGSEICKKTPK